MRKQYKRASKGGSGGKPELRVGERGVLLTSDAGRERNASMQLSDWLKDVHETLREQSDRSVLGKRSEPEKHHSSTSDGLAAELQSLRQSSRPFQLAHTGVPACAFLRQMAFGSPSPTDVVLSALRHVQTTKETRCKNTVRILPVETTSSSSADAIASACKPLIEHHFPTSEAHAFFAAEKQQSVPEDAKEYNDSNGDSDNDGGQKQGTNTCKNTHEGEPLKHSEDTETPGHTASTVRKTFAIRYNKRGSPKAPSHSAAVDAVAKLVPPPHRVNLTKPELTIIIEVVRNVACIAVVPQYFDLCKFNLRELAMQPCAGQQGRTPISVKEHKEELDVGNQTAKESHQPNDA